MTHPVLDQFSPLDGKIGDTGRLLPGFIAKTWVPDTERRRLAAYEVRDAYRTNNAHRYILDNDGNSVGRGRREYGDPAAYEDRLVAAIRGDEQTIVVDGADDDLLEGPELPRQPEAPKVGADGKTDPLEDRVYKARLKAWQAEAEAIVKRWEEALAAQPEARNRQDALREWADTVHLQMHLNESDHDAVGLGDSAIVLWPRQGDWPMVQVYDPESYFPELPANGDWVEFPDGVHFTWEYRDKDRLGVDHIYVRRLTWRLMSITLLRSVDDGGVLRWVGPDGVPLADGARLMLNPAETLGADGIVRRRLPWHADNESTDRTCAFSDLTWDTKDIGSDRDALEPSKAVQRTVENYDFVVDFLPVIHRPNTSTGKQHYGRSIFDLAMRLFDDISLIDTRVMSASGYLGHPTIGLTGATATDGQVMPGRVFNLGEKGSMDVLDLSSGLEQLMNLGAKLEDRLGFTLGMPGQMTGRGDAGDGASGIRLLLELLPAISLVGGARQVREPKDALLLKMAQRMAQVAVHADGSSVLPPGPTPKARMLYGNFLPTDVATTTEAVAKLLIAHAISTQTAVTMLVAAGLPIDDARAEVERIIAENTEAAVQVADALGGAPGEQRIVAERLGVELDAGAAGPVAPPVVTLPPAGGGA